MTLCTQPAIMALLCAAQRNGEVETIEVVAKTYEGIYIKTGHQIFCFVVLPPFSVLTEKERESDRETGREREYVHYLYWIFPTRC